MAIITLEYETLGEIVNPLLKKYKVKLAFLSRVWEVSERELRKLLHAPLKDKDDVEMMAMIEKLLRRTGYFPTLQGVYDNFALLAARNTGFTEPKTCNVRPNINTDPFLIELFTQLFRCFDTNNQRKLVWDLLYSETDDPVWIDSITQFVEDNLDWANNVYWKWHELNFADLDFDAGFTTAIQCINYVTPDLDIISILDNTPSSLIMNDLISEIEACCAPPDDQRMIHRLNNSLIAHFENRKVPSFNTIFGILLSPLWSLNAGALTAEEEQEVHSAIRFLEYIRQYQYPPIKIPSLEDMQKLGSNPARYTREMLALETKATVMQNVWPSPAPEGDIATWVFILDWQSCEDISNVIDRKWPDKVTAGREYAQNSMVPQQDKSAIQYYVLSTTMPSYRKMAAQLAAACATKEKALCLRLPRLINSQYFAIVVGPDVQTNTILSHHGFDENEKIHLPWRIGGELYTVWTIPYSFENAERVNSLGSEISRISHQLRRGDGGRQHSPFFHVFKVCRSSINIE